LLFGQQQRQARGAEAAIAFAEKIDRRVAAAEPGQRETDGLAQRVEILAHPEKALLRVLAALGDAVAGADRIDEDEVGEIEPRIGVVCDVAMGGRQSSAIAEIEDARSGGEEVEIGRSSAGP